MYEHQTRSLKNRMRESDRQDVYADYHASKRAGVSGMDYTDDRLANKALVIGVQVEERKTAEGAGDKRCE